MADDLKNRGPQDRSRINMSEDWEVQWWTQKFGVTVEQLKKAVSAVGSSAEAVAKKLGKSL
jgi:hypothetical protein